MKSWLLSAISVVLLSVGFNVGSPADAKTPYPALKGVTKCRVDVSVSKDVKIELFEAGAPNLVVGSELLHLAETKLREAGISPMAMSEDGPKVQITADVDMSNDEFTVTVSYYDWVTLVRDPSVKFETRVWSKKGHPAADEAKELKATVADLLDQFIADKLAANPAK